MKRLIVDTNAFLRFLLNDIPEQKTEVEELLQQAEKSKVVLIVPQIIVFEVHFILDKYYHFEKGEILKSLKSLVSTNYLQVENRETFLSALVIYSENNLSFVDCFIAADAEKQNAEVFTFDKKLGKLD